MYVSCQLYQRFNENITAYYQNEVFFWQIYNLAVVKIIYFAS